MKSVFFGLLVLLVANSVSAQDIDRLAALEVRVQKLEERIAKLESSVEPLTAEVEAEQRVNRQRMKAQERMRADSEIYSPEQLREIEDLYQVANRQWQSQEAKDSLKKLLEKYDGANRTGCALLYLGQMSEGEDKETYLTKAIDGFSDCYYGDGAQVGAYARYHLAYYYRETGQEEKAEELFKEIIREYPDAIDHRRRFLKDLIEN